MQDITQNNMMDHLIFEIEKTVTSVKERLARAVNQTIMETYWKIGQYIVEFERDKCKSDLWGKTVINT
ncbi:MAG: hypothetical protein KHW82_12740 [Lachnospiraceae bacterium]|nr:hypothetical protein [Lachnospiraceae bacterium]